MVPGLFLGGAAPPEPHKPADEIIVTGHRADQWEERRRAASFVRSLGVANGQQPAARWIDPVCPHVIGLQQPYADMVEARMREVAGQAGIAVAARPCVTNIAVTFSQRADRLARHIARRKPRQLSEVPTASREMLLHGNAPIRWWYQTERRDRDGIKAGGAPLPWTGGNAEGGGSALPTNSDSVSNSLYNSSMISTQSQRALTSATILVDVDGTSGLPLTTVADYVALVAFAEIKQAGARPPESILALFGTDENLRSITEWDLAFLRRLYEMPLDRNARRHRGALVGGLLESSREGAKE